MASQCVAEPLEQEAQPQLVPANSQPAVQDPQQMDYDFVEQPPQDFFCPVTFELLIEPHLTICCGNHLSQEAANRLQRDGKPCPMCKEPLNVVPNKHFKRKLSDIKVRCPHKKSDCEWVGGVNEVKQHSDSCPKRPWQCEFCGFSSTYDIGVSEHVPTCTLYPVLCPNSCDIVPMPRCDLESHLVICPLQPVACGYAEVGCDVKVPRRDLAHHMEESQQQHLLSATLLNLRLTKQTEQKIVELKQDLTAKDKKLDEVKRDLASKDAKIADLQSQIERFQKETQKQLHDILLQGSSVRMFTLTKFKECQARGNDGDWNSELFDYSGGYKIQLLVETNGYGTARGKFMSIGVMVTHDNRSFPATFSVSIQLLNQLGDHNHHEREASETYPGKTCRRLFPEFIKLIDLERDVVRKTQYLKDNCLRFRVYFKRLS